jgi:hypothetical protein
MNGHTNGSSHNDSDNTHTDANTNGYHYINGEEAVAGVNGHRSDVIEAKFQERYTLFVNEEKAFKNVVKEHKIETEKSIPKLGVLVVGLGGNNGSTMVAGLLANKKKLEWDTRNGTQKANFYGSFTQCSTAHVGFTFNE